MPDVMSTVRLFDFVCIRTLESPPHKPERLAHAPSFLVANPRPLHRSTLYIVGFAGVAAKAMVNTTIAAAAGSITAVILNKCTLHYWDASAANNGLLGGLVAITAGCATSEPEGALVIGVVAGFVYTAASKALVLAKVRFFVFSRCCA